MLSAENGMLLLAKVFPKRGYAEEFLEGKLYANRLSAFKRIEDDSGRGDDYEGGAMVNTDGIVMTLQAEDQETGGIQEIVLRGPDFHGPIKHKLPSFDHLNLFCMYGVQIPSSYLTPENTAMIKERMSLSERYRDFGDYVVVITNAPEFIRRVVTYVNQKQYHMSYNFVDYYDPDVGTALLPNTPETLFAKQNKYAWQEEFRFVIDTHTVGDEAIVLDIGGIDDIALLWDISDMIDNLKVRIVASGENPPSSD